ncbi:intraflagellar transport protein 20 like [Crotalus adamanteus]
MAPRDLRATAGQRSGTDLNRLRATRRAFSVSIPAKERSSKLGLQQQASQSRELRLQLPASPARRRPFPIYAVEGHQDYISRQATAMSFAIQAGTPAEAGAIERFLAENHGKGVYSLKEVARKPFSDIICLVPSPLPCDPYRFLRFGFFPPNYGSQNAKRSRRSPSPYERMGYAVVPAATCKEFVMAKDILGEAGLHFDELNKLRVLDPEVAQQTTELKEECRLFVDKIAEFKKIVGNLIELVDQLAKATENEKIKAIGARNLLKSIAKQREAQQQQLQALIAEKKTQLERYRVEYQTLCKIEADQNEFIDQFIFQK